VEEFDIHQFKEGVNISSAFGQVADEPRAHPNAAKVFVNWLLSREGQATFQSHDVARRCQDSAADLPKEHIPASDRRRDGMKYFDTTIPIPKTSTGA
jgi:ABC-type Fe3+ transport system substrate-binding protein